MPPPRLLAGLRDVSAGYDVLLCDIWGVIHDGMTAFPAACEALSRWREGPGPVILISNSPRPAPEVIVQLDSLGVPRQAWSAVVTSGDASRELLRARAPGPAYRIGPARDDPLYEGLGLRFAPLEAAAFIACTGPNDDETETPEDYRDVLGEAAALGLEMVCANPDIVVQRGARLIYCGGALAQLYRGLGGVAIMAGKPHPPIYRLALEEARASRGDAGLDPRRVLAIGDGVSTDIAGAEQAGLDALFVAGGIHGAAAVGRGGRLEAGVAERLLAQDGLGAAYAMTALAW
jgi:HAD superfamily hydrolase (TIGR01459 family)